MKARMNALEHEQRKNDRKRNKTLQKIDFMKTVRERFQSDL